MNNFSDYILIFNQKSPFINPITSDTLMGGFLYYLSLKDKAIFSSFYQEFYNGKPPFLTSSFFPYPYIPIDWNFLLSLLEKEDDFET